MCTPARSKATRSRASSGADCHVRSCAVVFATNRPVAQIATSGAAPWSSPRTVGDAAFARAAAHHAGRQGLQTPRILAGRDAHHHVLDDAPIQRVGVHQGLGTSAAGPHARRRGRAAARPPLCRARPARLGWAPCPRGLMRIPRTAQRRAILLQHRASSTRRPERTINSKSSAFVSTRSATSGRDRTAGDSTAAIGYARLFHGGSLLASLRPRLLTTRVPRAVRSRRSQISTVSRTSPCAGAGAGLILLRKAEDIA